MNRRHFLNTLTGASVASPALLAGAPEGFIDAHVHVWTPDTRAYPLAPGFTPANMVPPAFTPEDLFRHGKPEGVTRIVLIQMSFYRFDNRYMLDVMAAHPGVFGGVAIVDDSQPGVGGAMKELARQGVRGFRVSANRAKAESWGEDMRTMWRHAADEGLAICLLADPEALPAIHKMCGEFPKTRVVIDHCARLGMKGSAAPEDVDRLCRLAAFPGVHVKTSAFYALGKKKAPYLDLAPLIRRLRDAYGAERLMWASDCPYQVADGHHYADSIALVRDRLDFLTEDDKANLLRTTAARLFFS
ncbi:MAG: amidohydrolase family protein [Verrucomicrobia bacterium]|nr:amidohydrolase family protein [Verrucomicrobiota bacterium]